MALNYATTWICYSGRGANVCFIYGKGTYIMNFYNMADASKTMLVRVSSRRLGAVIHSSAGIVFGMMMGIRGPSDVTGLTGGGLDWGFDAGIKIGAFKNLGKQLMIIAKSAATNGSKAVAKSVSTEAFKQSVNGAAGNLKRDRRNRGFYMAGTPAGLGLGGGFWNDKQTVEYIGDSVRWKTASPRWRVRSLGGKLWLQAHGVPIASVSTTTLHFYESHGGNSVTPLIVKGGSTDPRANIYGESFYSFVDEFKLCHSPLGYTAGESRTDRGYNISNITLVGKPKRSWGGLGSRIAAEPFPKGTFKLRVGLEEQGKEQWRSKEEVTIWTNESGQWYAVLNPGNRWRS